MREGLFWRVDDLLQELSPEEQKDVMISQQGLKIFHAALQNSNIVMVRALLFALDEMVRSELISNVMVSSLVHEGKIMSSSPKKKTLLKAISIENDVNALNEMIKDENFTGISAKLAPFSMDDSESLIFDRSNITNPLLSILLRNGSVHRMLNLVLSYTSTDAQAKVLNSEFGVEIFENVLGKGSFDEINSDQIESLKIIYASLTVDEFSAFTNQDGFDKRIYEPENMGFMYPKISTIIAEIRTEKQRKKAEGQEETRLEENAILADPIIQSFVSQDDESELGHEIEPKLDATEELTQDMAASMLTREMSIESSPSNNPSPTQNKPNRPLTPEIDDFAMDY